LVKITGNEKPEHTYAAFSKFFLPILILRNKIFIYFAPDI